MATNTAASFTNHTGNGTAGPFSISFSYLAESEVDVTVGGVLKTLTTHYTFTSGTQITFTSGNEPANGAVIKIQRDTNVGSKKIDFNDGSVLTESDLDTQNDQLLFAVQEITDNFIKRDGTKTVTGDLSFEGATDNTNETKLAITDPTADRTITLPDTTGTVVTTGDTGTVSNTMLAGNSVDSSKIADGSIVNADINASAAIDGSKLQAASSSNAGSMSASDKSKLDAIESSATGDQSNAEIKTAYEANSDTNAFTDAEKTKLSGIATGAEVNVQSDFNATSGDAVILNKPTIPSALNDLSDVNTTGAADGKILKFQSSSNTFIIADDANDGGGGGGSLTDGDKGDITVSSSGASWSIDASAVSTNKIADDAVTQAKIADDAVGADQIANNAVVEAAIANDAVTRDKINAISTSSLPSFEAKGTSGSTEGYIQLNCAENSHGIKLKSPPHSAAASYTFTFPQNIQNGQFLTTDASGNTSWSAIDLTALSASNLTSGTIPDARFPATLPAASAANLTSIPAANITGTLPALSAANLTSIPAANITGTLPAIDGSNLTGISGGISDVVSDTTPQLGGNLDLNSKNITGTGNINTTGSITASGSLSVSSGVSTLGGSYVQGTGDGLLIYGSSSRSQGVYFDGSSNMFRPTASSAYDLGSSSYRFATVYSNNSLNTSDENLKNTINTCDLGLGFINKLRPVSYKWNQYEGQIPDTKTHYGFVAQEIETVLTSESKTLDDFAGVFKPDDYKADGTGGAMALAPTEFLSPLIKAVQELSAEVETLKTKVAALEAA